MILGLESSDAKASFYGLQELLTEKILTIKEKFEMIDKITEKDVQNIARDIFQPQNLNLALLGPHKNDKVFKRVLTL